MTTISNFKSTFAEFVRLVGSLLLISPRVAIFSSLHVHLKSKGDLLNPCWRILLGGDELLPAVDVVGRAREGSVGHDVHGERGDVSRFDDAPNGKCGPKLIAAVFELIAEEFRR